MQLVPIRELPSAALVTDFCFPASAASTVFSQTLIPKGRLSGLRALFPVLLSRQVTRETAAWPVDCLPIPQGGSSSDSAGCSAEGDQQGGQTHLSEAVIGPEEGCRQRVWSDAANLGSIP